MEKFEQAVYFFALVMGILLMREGISALSEKRLAVVLAGPDDAQKSAQAEFLRRRYGLHVVSVGALESDAPDRYLLEDCSAVEHETRACRL